MLILILLLLGLLLLIIIITIINILLMNRSINSDLIVLISGRRSFEYVIYIAFKLADMAQFVDLD